MKCNCNKWNENNPKLMTVTMSAHVHGVYYDGDVFEFCPWCGKHLLEDIVDTYPCVSCANDDREECIQCEGDDNFSAHIEGK